MSKGNGWIPLDKGLIKTLNNIDRPFSYIEAMFSYTLDADNDIEGSINGYAKLWQWSRGKVRRFINSMRTGSGHIADRKGTGSGHPIHFIDKGLWAEADRKRTYSGQEGDRKEDTTIDPNPNPKEKPPIIPPKKPKVKTFKQWDKEDFEKHVLEANNGGLLYQEEITDFIDYWMEKSASGKTKLSMQKTWDTRRRMQTALRIVFEKRREFKKEDNQQPNIIYHTPEEADHLKKYNLWKPNYAIKETTG